MFEDSSGIQRSLCDLEGKIIYVDLWATWCTPCLIQSKYFEELARTFEPRNDDIEFVGISLDHDVDRWKEMLKDGDFEGIQLLAKDGFNSKICQDFEIRGIPRFMVFDRDGIVIRPNALPPSRDGLEDYLNSLLEER